MNVKSPWSARSSQGHNLRGDSSLLQLSLPIAGMRNADKACGKEDNCSRATIWREKARKNLNLNHFTCQSRRNSPMLLLPKKRPDLVEEVGGGGFWICDAVGARD